MKSLCQPPSPRLSGLFHKVSKQQNNTSTCTNTWWMHYGGKGSWQYANHYLLPEMHHCVRAFGVNNV